MSGLWSRVACVVAAALTGVAIAGLLAKDANEFLVLALSGSLTSTAPLSNLAMRVAVLRPTTDRPAARPRRTSPRR
jgi:hypothetical protein